MDLLPYFLRSQANYGKTLKLLNGDYIGTGNISEQRQYKHVDGDIDFIYALVEPVGDWASCPDCFQNGKNQKIDHYKYVSSEETLYLKIDALPVWPRHYNACRWFKRYMNLNDVIDNSDDVISDYDPSTGQLTEAGGLSGGQRANPEKTILHEVGTANLGGSLGVVDYVTIDCYWSNQTSYPIERNTFAKDWGWVRWQLVIADAPVWQSGHSYVAGNFVYDPNASYGGVTGLTWMARTSHLSSLANKPSSTVAATTDWFMMGPSRWLNPVTQAKQVPDFSRLIPPWFDPVGPYLSAVNGGGSDIIPNRAYPNIWEQFTVTKVSGNVYNIQAYNGKYLCAINGGGSSIVADRDSPSTWEQFTLSRQADGYYTIRTYDAQHFVCAENGGEAAIVADRTNPSTWEKFGFHQVSGNVYNIWTFNKDVFGPEFSSMPSLSTVP